MEQSVCGAKQPSAAGYANPHLDWVGRVLADISSEIASVNTKV